MDARLIADIQGFQTSLVDAYELGLQSGDAVLGGSEVYLELMEELCSVKNEGAIHEQAMATAKETASNYEEYEQIYAAEVSKQKSKAKKPKNTTEYKNFQNRLSQMKNSFQPDLDSDEDEQPEKRPEMEHVEFEEFVMETQINPFDPLTKQRMTEPVRNKHCGHHYEQSSIAQAVKINARLRCPVAGCGNKQFVQMQDLFPDDEFKMRLKNVVDMAEENDDDL